MSHVLMDVQHLFGLLQWVVNQKGFVLQRELSCRDGLHGHCAGRVVFNARLESTLAVVRPQPYVNVSASGVCIAEIEAPLHWLRSQPLTCHERCTLKTLELSPYSWVID